MTLDNKAKQSDEFFPFIWKVVDEYRELLNHIKTHDVATKQTLGIGSQHDLQTLHQMAQCNKQQKMWKNTRFLTNPPNTWKGGDAMMKMMIKSHRLRVMHMMIL